MPRIHHQIAPLVVAMAPVRLRGNSVPPLDPVSIELARFLPGSCLQGVQCNLGGRVVRLIIRWLVNALSLLVTAALVPGVVLRGVIPSLLAAAVLGIVNALIRPILLLLSLPLNLVTLGLFTLVINALMLWLTSALVPGFSIRGFWAAFFGSIVLSLISFILSRLIH